VTLGTVAGGAMDEPAARADRTAGADVSVDPELRARALALGAATLHEASGGRGALPSRIRPVTGLPLVGRVLTVECPPLDNLWLHRAILEAAPGDVLVASVGPGREAGYWGEILAEGALRAGIAGLVIDGGVRDVRPMRELGFPVFAERLCIRGTGKSRADVFGGLGGPLAFDDVTVHAGDLVVGDEDGVVVVAAADVGTVVAAGEERAARESVYVERIRAGDTTLAVMGLQ
jgi:4-hydroxy-4-methyl-2-oxoglutarate aldolase